MLSTRLFLLFLFCVSSAFGQATFSISGTIKDYKEVLPGASVYVSGYKMGTSTNGEGKFILPNLKPGNYDILVQMIGYIPFSKNVIITDKSVIVELKLNESTTKLNEVIIKPDPDREWLINLFKEFFIGKTPNAVKCKILNTNILDIDHDKRSGILIMKASEFLIIENEALGYRIKYLLENFEYNFNTKILFYAGYPTFEDLKGGNAKQKKWLKNREVAYKGSAQHFFTSLYQNRANEEGFIINKRYEIPNKNRLPDSLIETNIKQLMSGKSAVSNLSIDNKNGNSINYWLQEKRKPKMMHFIDRTSVLTDTLVKTFNSNFKMINFKDDLFVIYKNEKESLEYEKSPYYQNRPLDLKGQVSVVKMLIAPVYFYANGVIYNPHSTLYSGYWSYEKMADTVPMDYVVSIEQKKN